MNSTIWLLRLLFLSLLPSAAIAASAVAVDKVAHKYGYCHAKESVEEARQCAIAICNQQRGTNCVVAESGSKGGNSAIAAGSGQIGTFLDSYESEEMVSARAMWDCQMKASGCGYDEVQTGQCQVPTYCKIVAKWSDPESPQPPHPGRTNHPVTTSGSQYPVNNQNNLELLTQANTMLRDKRFDEAIALYTQFISASPNSPGAYNNRGSAYSKKSPPDYQAAFQDFDQAIRLRPSGMYYYNRALMSHKLGNQQSYLDDLKQSVQMGYTLAKTKLEAMAQGHSIASATLDPTQGVPLAVPPVSTTQNESVNKRISTYGGSLPLPPSNVGVFAKNGLLTITWNKVSGATSYNVYCTNSPGVTKKNGNKNTTVVNSYVAATNPGSTYYLVVTAVNENSESPESAEVKVTTPGTKPCKGCGNSQGLNQAQINAMETERKLMWNATGGDMIYK